MYCYRLLASVKSSGVILLSHQESFVLRAALPRITWIRFINVYEVVLLSRILIGDM